MNQGVQPSEPSASNPVGTLLPATGSEDDLLSAEFIQKLDRLDVLSRKILAGKLQGERRSKKKGRSVEFADYRPYVAGDDLRFLDWNLYARLDRLFLRLFLEEEDLCVQILLDTSRSMDWGEPNKLMYAKRLAAAVGYIGLTRLNRVGVYCLGQTIVRQITGLRGRRPIPRLFDFLRHIEPQPSGDLAGACKTFALTQRQKGVVLILSDFLEKGDVSEALKYLSGDRYDVYVMQLLAPGEIDPAKANLMGDLRLLDCEDGQSMEVSLNPALIKRYQESLRSYCQEIRDQCHRRGMTYLLAETSVPFDTLVLRYLRDKQLLG